MIRNQGFTEIALDLTVLLLFSILFAIGNVFALKKHRKNIMMIQRGIIDEERLAGRIDCRN